MRINMLNEGLEKQIIKAIHKVTIVPSAVNIPTQQHSCTPECIDWIMKNQNSDGSWALPFASPFLMKHALSSTLACVIALKQWNVGNQHVERGIHFIVSNFSFATDEGQHSPVGFNIIFPSMIQYLGELGLELPVSQTSLDNLFQKRDLELKRGSESKSEGWKAYLANVAEGLDHNDWDKVMKFQNRNGSLFNPPSTTAIALTHLWDDKSLQYLNHILPKFDDAAPILLPFNIYTSLSMIDYFEKMGIGHHFEDQIKRTLDDVHRWWTQENNEIHLETTVYAMAFRILRMQGYDISSDAFAELTEDNFTYNSREINQDDLTRVMELYKASQLKISQNEKILDRLNSWSKNFLEQSISSHSTNTEIGKFMMKEVENTLMFPSYADLERLEHKRNIENSIMNPFLTLKTSSMFQNVNTKDIMELAVEDFNSCQSMYSGELELFERWIEESGLNQLNFFSRPTMLYCYFSAAAAHFPAEMSDVRMAWAKNSMLTTIVDDFFDGAGSRADLINFVQLVKRWDTDYDKSNYSGDVNILFYALHATINELGMKASALHGYDVTSHLIEIWVDCVDSMMREAEWQQDKTVPTMEEYMSNACVSFALGPIILPAIYFVGPKLQSHVIGRNPECDTLNKLMGMIGRLLNDIQGFKKDQREGKLTSVRLRMLNGDSEEEANREIWRIIETSRIELLKLVLQNEGSIIPRACKDLFWKMSKTVHLFYKRNDGFRSRTELMGAVRAVIYEAIQAPDDL